MGRSTPDQCAWDHTGRRQHSDDRVGAAGTSREEMHKEPLDPERVQWPAWQQSSGEEIREQRQQEARLGIRRKTVVKAELGGRQDEREVPRARL